MKVPFFKVCQQRRAFLAGAGLAHDLAAFDRVLLALRDIGPPVRHKIITRPWLRMVARRLKRHQQRWTLPPKPHASGAMAMAAALVPFGPLAPTLSVPTVRRKLSRLAPHPHPRLTAAHDRGARLLDGSQARLPRLLQREARLPTLRRGHRLARPPRGLVRLEVLGILAPVLPSLPGVIERP